MRNMSINYFCLQILCVLSTLTATSKENTKEANWMQDLHRYLKQDFHAFQTIILIDHETNSTNDMEDILQTMITRGPSKIINIRQAKVEHVRTSIASRSIQLTTQFLIILSDATADPKEPLKYILQISRGATHPRCLMIQLQGNFDHLKLFHFAWTEKILDFTILELMVNSTRNFSNGGLNFSENHQNSFLMLHHYNPYNKSYVQKPYLSGDVIFPNKLYDLKGYEMKVVTFESQHYVTVERNLTGHRIPVSGLKLNIRRVLQEMQNFQVLEVSYPGIPIGNASCQLNKSTGMLNKLYKGQFHFFTNPLIIPSNCKEYVNMFAFENENYRLMLLVPVTRSSDKLLSMSTTSLVIGLSTTGLIIFLCFTVRLLRLDREFWKLFNIFQMLLGLGIEFQIRKNSDRMFFPFTFFGFMIVSSELYSLLTDIEISIKTEKVLKTLEDVNKSDLVPILYANDRDAASALDQDNVIQDLLKKTLISPLGRYCEPMLVKYKNATCLFKETDAIIKSGQHMTKDGYAIIQVLPEVFMETPNSIMMEPNFPSAFRFQKNINRMTQVGLKVKWMKDLFSKELTKKSEISLMEDQSTLLVVLLWVIILGLALSFIAFLTELLIDYRKKSHLKFSKSRRIHKK